MFQLLGVEVTKAQLSFDTTVISRVQKVGSIVPLETRIYALWSLNIEGGNILYNSVGLRIKASDMLRHDLGITIDTILTDLQIARVQSALKSGFVYVDGQTRRHSPFSFSIRGRSYQQSARVTQQESKGSSWFSSVQLIVRLSC